MLSTVASPFTAVPLQIHRSLHKVKKARSVYFGRWNIFWKYGRSAIFSFWWLREPREQGQHGRGERQDHVTAAIVETNDKAAQINFKMSVDWYECGRCVIMSPRSSQLIQTSQQAAAEPLHRPYGARAFQQRDAETSVEAAAGWTTWEWKLILFTFNLPFPPLQNLERAKSCNTRIKSKCSRNGPTGSRQQEALAAWPRWPAARSNRYAQFSNTYSQITITRIWTPSSSRKNKGADFLRPCEFERVFVCLSASTRLYTR